MIKFFFSFSKRKLLRSEEHINIIYKIYKKIYKRKMKNYVNNAMERLNQMLVYGERNERERKKWKKMK